MKTIHNILKASIFCLIITFGFSGCIKKEYFEDYHDHYHSYYETGVELTVYNFTIGINDWKWNQIYERYECVLNFKEITEYIYEKGFVNAQVFVWEKNRDGSEYETLKPLPFVQSYFDEFENIPYTETISYDVSPGYILFSIQLSELWSTDEWLNDYDFKVSIMK